MQFSLEIVNEKGLHARASAKFVETVERFDARALVSRDGMEVSGDSIMGLMMLGGGAGNLDRGPGGRSRSGDAGGGAARPRRRAVRGAHLKPFHPPAGQAGRRGLGSGCDPVRRPPPMASRVR